VIPAEVRYHRATTVEDALEALAEEDSRALAGGQSLLPVMRLRLARPSLLVDISHIDVNGAAHDDDQLPIGALTTWDHLVRVPGPAPSMEAIAECAAGIGDLQVRNRGTIGGSLAHADPASDMSAVLLALGAEVKIRSAAGSRSLPLADFFVGPFTTALEQGELITAVTVPKPPAGAASAYAAVEHPASGFALAGAAALALPDGSTRTAVTGIAATPFVLDGTTDPASALAEVEVFGERFAPAEYRRDLAATVVARAVERARARVEAK
jgi:aerobic carbon-monoxide dehydrogenase medium subunit